MAAQNEKAFAAIYEFTEQLKLFDKSKSLEMFGAITKRCVEKSPKVKPDQVIAIFRKFVDYFLPFLETNQLMSHLPKDTLISYDAGGKVSIPLGEIVFKSRGNTSLVRSIRQHLVVIGALVAGSTFDPQKVKKIKKLVAEFEAAAQAAAAPKTDLPPEELDEQDKKFFSTLPKIPGLDIEQLAAIGKQSFGELNQDDTPEDIKEKMKQGISGLIDSELFQTIMTKLTEKADSGEFAGMDQATGMQQMMMMGASLMGQMKNADENTQ